MRAAAQRRGDAGDADAGAELEHALAADGLRVLREPQAHSNAGVPDGIAEAGGAEGELAQRNRTRRQAEDALLLVERLDDDGPLLQFVKRRSEAVAAELLLLEHGVDCGHVDVCRRRARGGEEPDVCDFHRRLAQAAARRRQ